MVNLGDEVEDTLTGFRGVVFGITEYLYGCRRAIVQPRVGKDGKYPDNQWVDEPQLKVLKTKTVMAIVGDNGGPVEVPRDNKIPRNDR